MLASEPQGCNECQPMSSPSSTSVRNSRNVISGAFLTGFLGFDGDDPKSLVFVLNHDDGDEYLRYLYAVAGAF